MKNKLNPSVSVIIPCFNEAEFLGVCMDSIVANSYSPKEILVIDGMSTDGSCDIIRKFMRKYKNIKLFSNPKRTTPYALNIGLSKSHGSIIMRMDAHALYPKDYIKKCVNSLKKYSADNVGGLWEMRPRKNSLVGTAIAFCLQTKFGAGTAHYKLKVKKPMDADTIPYFCCRRELFNSVGRFNERLARGQDMEFSLRLKKMGYKTVLDPAIKSIYFVRSGFLEFFKHNFNNGMWAILPFKYSNHAPVSFRHLIPVLSVSALVILSVLSFYNRMSFYVFLSIVGIYAITSIFYSLKCALLKKEIRYLFLAPAVFINLHLGYGIGSLSGLFVLPFRK